MRGDCISDNEGINARDAEERALANWKSPHGPSTYLHAGASAQGWPADHKAEDTFDIPAPWFAEFQPKLNAQVEGSMYPEGTQHDLSELKARGEFYNSLTQPEEREYRAEFGTDGSARLVLDSTRTVGHFDTFADAQLAAEALNNHKGY